jgi:hypothetical protein
MVNDAANDPKYKATGFNVRAIPARGWALSPNDLHTS